MEELEGFRKTYLESIVAESWVVRSKSFPRIAIYYERSILRMKEIRYVTNRQIGYRIVPSWDPGCYPRPPTVTVKE